MAAAIPTAGPTEAVTRTAVVTGAARGIGLGYCERLVADGHTVVGIDIDDPTAALDALARDAGETLGLSCDLGDPDAVRAAAAEILERFGRVDILVNNAAWFPTVSLDQITLETWRRVQAVNVEAGLLLAQTFAPGMREQGWGRIVATGSANTLTVGPDLAYMTSKGTVHTLTRALANELGAAGITANAIAPSVVATEGFTGRDRAGRRTAEETLAAVSGMQSIPRVSTPGDLAGALAWLISDDAAFYTGQILHVDGGLTRSGA